MSDAAGGARPRRWAAKRARGCAPPRAHRTARLAVALLVGLAAARDVAALDRSRWPIEIAQPGWVRLPLDEAALVTAGERSFRIEDPGGAPVPAQLAFARDEAPRRPARVTAIAASTEGWWLTLDLGPGGPPHERLLLDFEPRLVAIGCRLEASLDGERFAPLAAGDLFRLGERATLERSALDYPPTAARWLRLFWPAAAGEPRLVQVEAVAATPTASPASVAADLVAPTALPPDGWRLYVDLPGEGPRPRRLLLAERPGAALAYRLAAPAEGRWRTLREGAVPAGAETLAIELPPLGLGRGRLRLDLYGLSSAARPPAGARFELEPAAVVFRAARAGRYALLAGPGIGGPAGEAAAEGETLAPATLGPREAVPWAPLSAAARALAAPPPAVEFARRFAVAAPGATAGSPVGLLLPTEIYRWAAAGAGDLRLVAEGRQVPYLISLVAAPEAAPPLACAPQAGERSGTSRCALDLPAPLSAGSVVVLGSRQGPFRRWVSPTWRSAATRAPGLPPAPPRALPASDWSCPPANRLPCELELPIASPEDGRLELEIADGDNPPLAPLVATLWRPRQELRFVWPASGAVELRVGAPGLAAPRYDLALAADELAGRPVVMAALTELPPAEGARGAWFGRWAAPAALALAALALVGLLAKLLRRGAG